VKWFPYSAVNKETKHLNINFIFPYKTLWNFSKIEKYNSILQNWQMIFQVLDYKENNFLNLINDENLPTNPLIQNIALDSNILDTLTFYIIS